MMINAAPIADMTTRSVLWGWGEVDYPDEKDYE